MSVCMKRWASIATTIVLGTCAGFGGVASAFAQSSSAAPAVGTPRPLAELTRENADTILVDLQGKSFIVAYSSKEASPAQTQQLTLVAQEAVHYIGRVAFLRLDVDKYPDVFAGLSANHKWDYGPRFFVVNNNPNFIGQISDNFNGASDPIHSISSVRLHKEIYDWLKVQPAP